MSEQPTGWRRVKSRESDSIIGWFEDGLSLVTLTKGRAHIVHKGRAVAIRTPEETFSSNPETIFKTVKRFLQ